MTCTCYWECGFLKRQLSIVSDLDNPPSSNPRPASCRSRKWSGACKTNDRLNPSRHDIIDNTLV